MAYIGREPQLGNFQVCDAISVVNAQAAYTMQVSSVDVSPESVNHMVVSLNGVIQKPGSSYTISSATITFSRNLVTGETIDFIYLLGNVLDLGTPSDDTVTGAKIVDNAINSEHYTDASIDLAHMSADSVDGSKIVDDAINSEHYTNASIDLAHMSADSVDGSKIVDDAINSEHYTDGSIDTAHLADGQITIAKLATAVLTGATDIGADLVDADLFLVDDGAGGTLRKTTAERIKTYIGGGTSWQAIKTGAYTAVAGQGVFANTTSSAFTVTLPASPALGDEVTVVDYAGTFDSNACTIGRNSQPIQGVAEDLVVSTERASFTLVYVDGTQGWLFKND